ncbi:Ig-like domain-containing protein [Streptomyces rapamycinicus]|uniref:Vegetative cell wall protein n=2 Tax=Streptomyces rapamycinicus TaxID=1226757 RepID=A0A3L8RF41_STRRN|nr:Ig-like domain-containing protein [Streptomyces rapamycinicus]MBB4786193.1 hypothetical protein [Streptomyces rapamycinicus]RLV78345.1 vegetative cell wall protein [Streptomyces rapamycinicus NRRL 5491]UTO66300.1 Ig-like domain-containing protein [Streptomyces rapamycinicus]UTP34255.1 Ig-like domain-containing protein [Streptomyces rapamycinicus NRRL 5491]
MASPTITLVTATPNPAVTGRPVTLTATVIPVGAAGTPTGTVTFVVSGGPTLNGTLSGGTASVTASGLGVGTHIVTATYNGDASFTPSTGTTAVVVLQASTTTSVTSVPDPSTPGQPVTFTATVTPVAPATGVPTGTVTFVISGSGGGTFTQPLSGGMATFTTSGLGAGSHTVTANYTDGATTIAAERPVDAFGFAFLPDLELPEGEWDVSAVYSGDANFGASGVSQYTQIVTGA